MDDKIRSTFEITENNLKGLNDNKFYFSEGQGALENLKSADKKQLENLKSEFGKTTKVREFAENKRKENTNIADLIDKINLFISYCDLHALGTNSEGDSFQEEPKKYIANAFVRQNVWVNNIITYLLDRKEDEGKFENVTYSVQNAIKYFEDPENRFPILSKDHREKISLHYLGENLNAVKDFDKDLKGIFAKSLDIEIKCLENCTYVYSQIIYSQRNAWASDIDTSFLENNHNIILTGAPGTGKTYLAQKMAEKLTGTKYGDPNNTQIKMVQFHPSYDYTDFVEGLRPKADKEGNIGFERKDGVFKEFCKGVLSNNNSIGNNNLEVGDNNFGNEKDQLKNLVEEEYYKLIENIKEVTKTNEVFKIPMKSYYLEKNDFVNKDAYYCELIVKQGNNKGQEIICIKKKNGKFDSISIKDILRGIKKYRTLDALENATTEDIFGKSKASYSWAILYYIYDKIFNAETSKKIDKQFENSIVSNSQSKNNTITNQPKERNYVFIIDEINRGELSKIFGELFFSIDPGYRGEKGKVNTQYQNLLKDSEDIFKNGFYVPENVYIIGTMNDIDRSVESMDFAFRRRFAFKEIKANDTKDDILWELGEEEIAISAMDAINDKLNDLGLSDSYHIGAAYFAKIKNYSKQSANKWNSLWKYHLEGTLFEYFRGEPNASENIKALKTVYDEAVKNQKKAKSE